MSYHIVAYCSENYFDAFDFVIKSWVDSSAEHIVVYTDTQKIVFPHPKVTLLPMYAKTDDWLTNVERKILSIDDFLKRFPDVKQLVFMDIDCYIARPFDEIFDEDFDIAVTRLTEKTPHAANTASAAPWFGKVGPGLHQFIKEWKVLAARYKMQKKGVRKHKVSFVQYSYTDLLRRAYESGGPYKVLPKPKNIYNAEDQNNDRWIETIKKYKSKILHFKSRKFRKVELVKRVFKALEE